MLMRVFFDQNCAATHAYDKHGKRYPQGEGSSNPSGTLLETFEIYPDSNARWFGVGHAAAFPANRWHSIPFHKGYPVKVKFNGATGHGLLAEARNGAVYGLTQGSPKPSGTPCNSFEIYHDELPNPGSCCWIKLGNQWYCLAC